MYTGDMNGSSDSRNLQCIIAAGASQQIMIFTLSAQVTIDKQNESNSRLQTMMLQSGTTEEQQRNTTLQNATSSRCVCVTAQRNNQITSIKQWMMQLVQRDGNRHGTDLIFMYDHTFEPTRVYSH